LAKNHKQILAFLVLLFAVMFAMNGTAAALPDSEVQQLTRISPDFKRAENRILSIWKNLTPDQRKRIRDEQIGWIETIRDIEAWELMDQGFSKAEAYTIVTDNRSDYLINYARGGQPEQSFDRPSPPPPAPRAESPDDSHGCTAVYVGMIFGVEYILTDTPITINYKVLGFNPKTGQVTGELYDDDHRGEAPGNLTSTCREVLSSPARDNFN
jgi:hypothetical protein